MPNLLDQPLLRTISPTGEPVFLTLPQTLHRMMQDEIDCFAGLRPHQEHAWHAFLVQLSVIAVTEAGADAPPGSPGEWREALIALTPDPGGWELVQEDSARPAFMPPPVSGEAAKPGKRSLTPDQIDAIFNNKNFETKQNVIRDAELDHWIYALVNAQTMSAYGGAGHPAVSRMNGGYSSRAAVSLAPQGGPGSHLRRDVEILLQNLDRRNRGRPALLWTLPWSGKKSESLDPGELHPLYIEVCRRIRLVTGRQGRTEALRHSAGAPRVDAKSKKGVTGDPWTPIAEVKGVQKPVHLTSSGFTSGILTGILLNRETWRIPPLLRPSPQEVREGPMTLVARGAAGGKCETNGYHHIQETIHPPLLRAIADPERAKEALDLAEARRRQIRAVRNCLAQAVETGLSGTEAGQENQETRKTAARGRAALLEQAAEAAFIRELQYELAAAGPEARQAVRQEWLHGPDGLVPKARAILSGTPARSRAAGDRAAAEFENRLANLKTLPGRQASAPPPAGPDRPGYAPQAKPGPAAALAPALAGNLARAAAANPRILGRLRRMNPDGPECPDFDALMATLGNAYDPRKRAGWALIVQGMALMTVVNAENARHRSAHREGADLGRVIAGYGGGNTPTGEFLPPDQAEAMLAGKEGELRRRLKPLLRRLGAAAARLDWAETAQLALEPGDRNIRRKILDDYHAARSARGRNG